MNHFIIRKLFSIETGLHIAQIYIYTLVAVVILANVLFFIGIPIHWALLPISFSIGIFLCRILYGDCESDSLVYEIIISVLLFVFLTTITGEIYDNSWDGNTYHKMAIGLLKNGWNPLRSSPKEYVNVGIGGYTYYIDWLIECYCKGTWIFAASVYAVTGNIECGKVYTLLMMFATFFGTIYFMKKTEHSNMISFLYAVIVACNPIAIIQMFSFYLDGFLHTTLFFLIITLTMNSYERVFDKKISTSLIFSCMILVGNAKFTGLLYGGLYCIGYFIMNYIIKLKFDRRNILKVTKFAISYIVMAFITIFVAGSSTYLTNLINHGSLCYPLTGKGKMDVLAQQNPFKDVNYIKNSVISLFSNPVGLGYGKGYKLKIPFTATREELESFNNSNPLLSGFGVLFSGIIIIAVIVLTIYLIKGKGKKKEIILTNAIVSVSLFCGIKESWYARMAPYIYIYALLALYIIINSKRKSIQILGFILIVIMFLNSSVPLLFVRDRYHGTKIMKDNISSLRRYDDVLVFSGLFEGCYFNLKDYDVYYHIEPNLVNDKDSMSLGYMDMIYKVEK